MRILTFVKISKTSLSPLFPPPSPSTPHNSKHPNFQPIPIKPCKPVHDPLTTRDNLQHSSHQPSQVPHCNTYKNQPAFSSSRPSANHPATPDRKPHHSTSKGTPSLPQDDSKPPNESRDSTRSCKERV
jgi:hypothetical protein